MDGPPDGAGSFRGPAQLTPRAAVVLAARVARVALADAQGTSASEAFDRAEAYGRGEPVSADEAHALWTRLVALAEAVRGAAHTARALLAACRAEADAEYEALVARAVEDAFTAALVAVGADDDRGGGGEAGGEGTGGRAEGGGHGRADEGGDRGQAGGRAEGGDRGQRGGRPEGGERGRRGARTGRERTADEARRAELRRTYRSLGDLLLARHPAGGPDRPVAADEHL